MPRARRPDVPPAKPRCPGCGQVNDPRLGRIRHEPGCPRSYFNPGTSWRTKGRYVTGAEQAKTRAAPGSKCRMCNGPRGKDGRLVHTPQCPISRRGQR